MKILVVTKSSDKTQEKFCWTNFNKIGDFYLIEVNLVQTVLCHKYTKISVKICVSADIQKIKYRWSRYSFICQGTSTRRQRRDDLFGLRVKLPPVTSSL